MACSGCGQNSTIQGSNVFLNIVSQKLGRCKKCIFIAALGTLFSWMLLVYILINNCETCNFLIPITLIAIGCVVFTSFLTAHMIAYYRINKKK